MDLSVGAPPSVAEPGGDFVVSVSIANTSSADDPITIQELRDSGRGNLLDAGNTSITNNTCPELASVTLPPGEARSCSFGTTISGNVGATTDGTVHIRIFDDESVAGQAEDGWSTEIGNASPHVSLSRSAGPSFPPSAVTTLDPTGCNSLVTSGQGSLAVFGHDANNPGRIAVDSAGDKAANPNVCGSNAYTIDVGSLSQGSIKACANNSTQAQPSRCDAGGLIQLNAMALDQETCLSGSLNHACDPVDISNGRLYPQPTRLIERSTRKFVDWEYNCRTSYPDYAPYGAPSIPIAGCNSGTPAYIDELRSGVGTTGDISPGPTWITLDTCSPASGTVFAPANYFVNCSDFRVGSGSTVTFQGGNIVFRGNVTIQGALNINTSNPAADLPDACRRPNGIAGQCLLESSARHSYIVLRNGGALTKGAEASINFHRVMVLLSSGGRVNFGAGSTRTHWTAPAQRGSPHVDDPATPHINEESPAAPFDNLALWSESTAMHTIGGQAPVVLEGMVFTPNALFHVEAQAEQFLENAQFVVMRMNVSGQGLLRMQLDPDLGIRDLPENGSVEEPGGPVVHRIRLKNESVSTDPITVQQLADDTYGDLLEPTNTQVEANECLTLGNAQMAPGGILECTFVARLDGNAGESFTDTLTVVALDDETAEASASGTMTVSISNRAPSLAVRVQSPTSIPEPGGNLTFSVTVSNTSHERDPVVLSGLTESTVGDLLDPANPLVSGNTCPVIQRSIAPGDTTSCSFEAGVTGNARSWHSFRVTARVSDDDGTESNGVGSTSVTISDVGPSVTLDITPTAATVAEPSGPVRFSMLISNGSNAFDPVQLTGLSTHRFGDLLDAANPSVSENSCSSLSGVLISPAASASCAFTASVEGNAGTLEDTSRADVVDDEGGAAHDESQTSLTITDTPPAAEVSIDPERRTLEEPGGDVLIGITVENVSNIQDPFTIGSLSGEPFGDLLSEGNDAVQDNTCPDLSHATIVPASSVACSFRFLAAGDAGTTIPLRVQLGVMDDESTSASAEDETVIEIVDVPPTITAHLTSNPRTIAGTEGTITYSLALRNTSLETVELDELLDHLYGDLFALVNPRLVTNDCWSLDGQAIPAGEQVGCGYSARVGPDPGFYTNVVRAAASDSEGNPAVSETRSNVNVVSTSSCPEPFVSPGGSITYTIPYGAFGAAAEDVVITDRLPDGFIFETAASADAAPVRGTPGGVVRWEIPNVEAGTTGILTITGHADPELGDGVLRNEVTVTADGVEPGTYVDEVEITTRGSTHDERASGLSVRHGDEQMIGPAPDSDNPDEGEQPPALPHVSAEAAYVDESGGVTKSAAVSMALAQVSSIEVRDPLSGTPLVRVQSLQTRSRSTATIAEATSDASDSWLSNVVVAGRSLGTIDESTSLVVPGPDGSSTEVHLLEQVTPKDTEDEASFLSSGLIVRGVHVVTKDQFGEVSMDVIVGEAKSYAKFRSGAACADGGQEDTTPESGMSELSPAPAGTSPDADTAQVDLLGVLSPLTRRPLLPPGVRLA